MLHITLLYKNNRKIHEQMQQARRLIHP